MSKVYFLGAGATKAVAQSAPLNDEILKTALYEPGYEEIRIEREEIKIFLDKVFHDKKNIFLHWEMF